MSDESPSILKDIALIESIEAAPTILRVVCRSTGMGFAAVARVTERRWVACSVHDQIDFGLQPGGELEVEATICREVRRSRKGVAIDHLAEDLMHGSHHTPLIAGFQSYVSTPIVRRDGSMFGTLCAFDPEPRRVKAPETLGMFELFAELIAFHIDAADRLATSEATRIDERRTAELHEEFIAVLGHDLRNPLASIEGGTRLLGKRPLDDKSKLIVEMMQNCTARMDELISNMLDLTRARLGGDFRLNRIGERSISSVLENVVAEVRSARPDRIVEIDCDLGGEPIDCDRGRVAQLFSNLLANALQLGDPKAPIRVLAVTAKGVFKLSVVNSGEPIPPSAMKRLFKPFAREPGAGKPQGVDLGLYEASEIARAHGGMLSVHSSHEETSFTFRMPLH